jgi:streptogramin lyase
MLGRRPDGRRWWSAWRRGSRRDRITGYAAVTTVVLLVAGGIVYGTGAAGVRPRLADVGAWLGNTKQGTVVHVNGLSGRVDGSIPVGGHGHRLVIVQDGNTVLVVDTGTGQVSRIDPSRIQVSQQAGVAAGSQVVVGGGQAYVVQPTTGTVQRIDPVTLATLGRSLSLTAPLGPAAVDDRGTLWVTQPAVGLVVPIHGGMRETAVPVGQPGDPLTLTIAQGTPLVTDARAARATVIGGGTVTLPSTVAGSPVLAPERSDSAVVPVLAPAAGALVLVDTATSRLSTVPVPDSRHRLGAPQVLAGRVYIPDQSAGSLIVYDPSAARFDDEIPVTGRAGDIEASVRDGLLWVDEPATSTAVVVDTSGASRPVDKYQDAGTAPATHRTTGTRPNPHLPSTSAQTPLPRASAAGPQAPAQVDAQPGPGYIDLVFSPSAGATPGGYELMDVPSGSTVRPGRVGRDGPFQFRVTGGSCGTEYRFRVAAVYGASRYPSSPSVPVRPCVAPGAAGALRAVAANHGATLSWTVPADTGGSSTTYTLSWTGATGGSRTGLTGTGATVTGLTNGGDYRFTLAAANAAGSAQQTTSTTATLVGPTARYPIYNNSMYPVVVRSGPRTDAAQLGSVPAGQTPTLTVACQVHGGSAQDPADVTLHGDLWDRVDWNGTTAYISDLYVATPQSRAGHYETFSDPLWQCS